MTTYTKHDRVTVEAAGQRYTVTIVKRLRSEPNSDVYQAVSGNGASVLVLGRDIVGLA